MSLIVRYRIPHPVYGAVPIPPMPGGTEEIVEREVAYPHVRCEDGLVIFSDRDDSRSGSSFLEGFAIPLSALVSIERVEQ